MSNFHKKWLDSKVQHLIYQNPVIPKLKHEDVGSFPNIIKFSIGERYGLYTIITTIIIIIIAIIIIIGLFSEQDPFDKEALGTYIGVFSVGLILCIFFYSLPKKKYSYNRLEGIITIPPKFYGKHSTFPFKEAKVYWFGNGSASGALSIDIYISAPEKKVGVLAQLRGYNYIQNWSYIVWYMDKNRPLPPDPIFDPYRDADFERRKAEGFPPPLYLSQIPTPEATKEQQKEREQYWKDKDYMGKTTSAWV